MMKKLLALVVSLLLLATMIPLGAVSVGAESNIIINGVDIGYANGDYFTKNGGACSCHVSSVNCVASQSDCNCMRYWPTGIKSTCQVDLLGSQCLGFARYCQWKVYGYFDKTSSSYFTDLTGSLSASECTATKLKSKLLGCAPATHVRAKDKNGNQTHSIVIIETNENQVIITEGNSDYKCRIRQSTYSWDQLASYIISVGGGGIAYAKSWNRGVPSTPSTPITYSTIDAGVYAIKNKGNQLYMNVAYGLDENAQNIHTYEFGYWNSQLYEITPSTTTAGYMMRPLSSAARVVNVYADNVVSGKNVCIYDNTGDDSQRWYFEKVEDGFVIRNVQNPSCVLTVPSGSDVCVQTYSGADNQIWTLENVVSYDANGGMGAPELQLKNYNESITLSTTKPSKDGYVFKGWATDASATEAQYASGGEYKDNMNIKLYAVWECDHIYETVVTNPDCLNNGYTTYTCSMCGDSYVDNYIDFVGHSYTGKITTPATCGADGVKTYTCSACGDSYTEAIPATGKHTYDNDCDATCNVCGGTRTVDAHAYSSKVTTAATCGAEGVKTYTCSACGDSYTEAIPATGKHTYDNDCDATCNVCGGTRTVDAHAYSSKVTTAATCGAEGVKTYTCSACGDSYTEAIPATGKHTYDNDCDTTCNTCGEERSIKHSYSAATCTKPETCTVCGVTQGTALGHTFDDEYDATCNACGAVREVPDKPITPDLPADAPAFVVESTTARAGEEFTIAIRTERNSGIVSFKLSVGYDSDVLELVAYEQKDFANMSFGPEENNPFILNWVDAVHPNNSTNGVVVLLTFRVKADAAAGRSDLTLTYDPEDIYDQNFDNVGFRVECGFVEIVDYISGDVNGDGKINNKDLGLLQRHLNGWTVSADRQAADVTADGKLNNKDLGLLQQYLNGWSVELG